MYSTCAFNFRDLILSYVYIDIDICYQKLGCPNLFGKSHNWTIGLLQNFKFQNISLDNILFGTRC